MGIKRLLRFIYNFTANDVGVLKAIFTPMPLQKGTVLTHDWQYGTGTIQAHKDGLHYPFRCTVVEAKYGLHYDAGDQVYFRVTQGNAVEVHAYQRANLLLEWRWCDQCKEYIRYTHIKERISDGDWGEYMAYFCCICGHEINPHHSQGFRSAYLRYKNKEMSIEQAEAFTHLLETHDSKKMIEFLKTWHFPTP